MCDLFHVCKQFYNHKYCSGRQLWYQILSSRYIVAMVFDTSRSLLSIKFGGWRETVRKTVLVFEKRTVYGIFDIVAIQ